jgi:hypothetical protein
LGSGEFPSCYVIITGTDFYNCIFQVTEIQSRSITVSFLTTEVWDWEKWFDFFHLNEKML